MNGYPAAGAGNGNMVLTGGYPAATLAAAQDKAQQAPVHSAQDSLDRAINSLLNEVEALRSALTPVLAMLPPQPGNPNATIERGPPSSVSQRINCSADVVNRASMALAEMRNRLEV